MDFLSLAAIWCSWTPFLHREQMATIHSNIKQYEYEHYERWPSESRVSPTSRFLLEIALAMQMYHLGKAFWNWWTQ
jgi:hypothetical protein